MENNLIPGGFKDDVTVLVPTEYRFKNMIINHFLSNGFQLIKTPLIEYTTKDTDKNTFKIVVKKNEKKLYLRDDITLQVARLSQTRLLGKKRPLKLCYYGEVVRRKGSMLRPERQFMQIGAESIGDQSFLADVEMMELAFTSLSLVGIKNITIEISSRVFFDNFILSIKNIKIIDEIKRLIKLKDLDSLLKILEKKHHTYIKNLFSCTGIYQDAIKNLDTLGFNTSTKKEIINLNNIVKKFILNNKNIQIFLDLCEIDDKNYHSGVRFTFYAKNIRGEIARGGRYFVINSKKLNVATGFTCYMDSILRASSIKLINKKILIPFNTSKNKVNNLIKKEYCIFKYTGELNITKKIAYDYNCQFYLINNRIKSL